MRLTVVFFLALGGLFPTLAHAHSRGVVSVVIAPLIVAVPVGMVIVGYDLFGRAEYGYPADSRAYGYYHAGVWYSYHAPRAPHCRQLVVRPVRHLPAVVAASHHHGGHHRPAHSDRR